MSTKTANSAERKTASEPADGPLLDKIKTNIKKLLAKGKERGYLTYDEINQVLPPEEFSSEQIEDTMAQLRSSDAVCACGVHSTFDIGQS